MTINMKRSWVMQQGHKIAKSILNEFDTYKEALSVGLRKAWKIAKGLLPNVEVEKEKVVHEDVQQEWAYSCIGALEVEVCESVAV